MRDERGVSEVFGYLLVFGLITTLAFIGATTGIAEIASQQEIEQTRTVERGFELLNRDFKTMQNHKDQRKATPVNIEEGSIGYGETTTITIGDWDGGAFTSDATTIETESIIYQHGDTKLTYDAGVLFNKRVNRDVLTRLETQVVVTADKAVVPIVIIDSQAPTTALAPAGEITFQSDYEPDTQTITERTVTGDSLKIQINTTTPKGWEKQLQQEGFENVEQNGETVRADIAIDGTHPDTATLSPTTIETEIQE